MSLDPAAGGGLFALDLANGKISMQVPPVAGGDRSQCSPVLSAAVTAIPGVVFLGGVSGYVRAYATADAKLLWEVDTARDFRPRRDNKPPPRWKERKVVALRDKAP